MTSDIIAALISATAVITAAIIARRPVKGDESRTTLTNVRPAKNDDDKRDDTDTSA